MPGLAHVDDVMAFPGGLPIKAGDVLVGAIGVSGATGDQDEECAQAGLDAVAEMLK
ncbi:MAG: GlcG/HbpS family heme-binding protein [Gammaproteobacteria bacterium]